MCRQPSFSTMAKQHERAQKEAARNSLSKKPAVTKQAAPKTSVAKSTAAVAGKKSPAGKPSDGKSRKALVSESARPQRQDLGSVVKPPASARGSFRWLAT